MFSKATANFVRQIDHEGSLIHVSRVTDSHKLVTMALVVKRNRIWWWQKPKYQPTNFTLYDLLQGDELLSPGVSLSEFASYEGMFGDQLSGSLVAEAGAVSGTLELQGSSELQSHFGKLMIEELDVKKLLHDSSGRQVNMEHMLVKQLEKRAEVLAVLKDKIFTTSSCSITQKRKERCMLQGVLKLVGLLGGTAKLCVNDDNNMEMNSDESLLIPAGTVIAYSVRELQIKKNGDYNICLLADRKGGIEADMPSCDTCDGKGCPATALQNGSGSEQDLFPLAELPQATRSELFQALQENLKDRSTLSYLQSVLQDLSRGETPDTAEHEELPDSQTELVAAKLQQLCIDSPAQNGQSVIPAPLAAAHLLVSAMEELPDEAMSILSESCPDFLEAIDTLMCRMTSSGEPVSIQCPPALLRDDQAFQLAQQLLSSTSATLTRDGDKLRTETGADARVDRLVLSISVRGLSLLCKGLKQ